MKYPNHGIAVAVACLALMAAPAIALESHEEAPAWEPPRPAPLELYACDFNEGKTMDDLMAAAEAWNAWMDEGGFNDYWAAILVPHFHSAAVDFDIGWAGLWPTGAAMAAGTEQWINQGAAEQEGFNEVVTCRQHALFGLMTLRRDAPFEPGPVQFSDCTMKEGHTMLDAMQAGAKWAAYQAERGIQNSLYMAFPIFGEASDASYSLKTITGSSYEHFGKNWDDMAGGSWRKSMELFGDLMDCDSARVYHSIPVRAGTMEGMEE